MDTKKWEDFLSDQELFESREHSHLPNGKYLVEKIVHDALHCLNSLAALIELMDSGEEPVPSALLQWFLSKEVLIESSIHTLIKHHHQELSDPGGEWPRLIRKIGSTLNGFPDLLDELDNLIESLEVAELDVIRMARGNLKGLSAMHADIQTEEYKRLWTIRRYHAL